MFIRQLIFLDQAALATLFVSFQNNTYFQPHPFTADEAKKICNDQTDYYCGIFSQEGLCSGYGMLRWGTWKNPSLGIAVHPDFRGRGLGKSLMRHLHEQAAARGSSRVRLRVHPSNTTARFMYEALGYSFNGEEDREQLVGWYTLP